MVYQKLFWGRGERHSLYSAVAWSWPDRREGSLPSSKGLNVYVSPIRKRCSWMFSMLMLSPGSVRGVGNCLSASGLWEKWNQIEERCAEWADSREWLSWLEVYKWKDREIPNRLLPLSKHILNCQYLFSRLWDVCPGNWWTAGNQNSPKGKELEKRMKSRRKRKMRHQLSMEW